MATLKSASYITKNKGADHVKKLEGAFDALYNYARNKSSEFEIESKKLARSSIRLITMGLVITIISTSVIVYLTYKSILDDLRVLKNGINEIVETKDLKTMTLDGKNEIVDMATDFNILISMLKLEIWKKESISSLQSELINTKELEEALELTLNHVVTGVGGIIGALFIYDQSDDSLTLKSSYGYSNLNAKTNFKMNEGIIGQVAAMRKPIYICNLDESEVVVESALISSKKISTFTFPVVAEMETLGVFEIAFIDEIETYIQEYLVDVGKILGSYLLSAKQKYEIEKYNREVKLSHQALVEKQNQLENLNQTLEEEIQEKTILEEELRTFTEELEYKVELRTDELSKTNIDLQQLNSMLEEEIDEKNNIQNELMKTERELIISRDKEKESNRSKSAFLANMSHEIRTPMNGIIGMLEVLNMTELDKEQLEYLKTVKTTSKTLLYILNDILDYSKIEAGKMEIRNNEFSISELVNRIIMIFTPLADEKNLKLSKSLDDNIPKSLIGDEARMQQIISNLVSNAIKFTESGEVNIKVLTLSNSSENVTLKIIISDTGRGIKKSEQEAIFERFSQLNEAGSKLIGSGLGLPISKALIKLMNGKISVESELDKGSQFTIEINLQSIVNIETNSAGKSLSMRTIDNKTRDYQILIVEDDFVSSKMLQLLLKKNNYSSIKVKSGEEALNIVSGNDISLILMDINLPGINGYETTKEIKKITTGIPIIAMTANVLNDENDKCIAAGMDDYLSKPIEIDEFFGKIELHLK